MIMMSAKHLKGNYEIIMRDRADVVLKYIEKTVMIMSDTLSQDRRQIMEYVIGSGTSLSRRTIYYDNGTSDDYLKHGDGTTNIDSEWKVDNGIVFFRDVRCNPKWQLLNPVESRALLDAITAYYLIGERTETSFE
jgi:hypothetical protein